MIKKVVPFFVSGVVLIAVAVLSVHTCHRGDRGITIGTTMLVGGCR